MAVSDELPPFFDCIYMRGVGDGLAYAYLVPKGDRAIVGSVFYPKTKHPSQLQDRVLDIIRQDTPALGATVAREACAARYVRRGNDIRAGSGRVLLAGEAGGFMSPTSGEGISYALRSGFLAGEAVCAGGDAVDILTFHAAKGLEWPVVHLAGVEDGLVPIGHAKRDAELAEERRLLRWLPLMESRAGKYLAGLAPTPLVSRVTQGL